MTNIIQNFKINTNDVIIAVTPLNNNILISLLTICNTSASPITVTIYKTVLGTVFTMINAITLSENSTFVYIGFSVEKNSTLRVSIPDGTADVTINYNLL